MKNKVVFLLVLLISISSTTEILFWKLLSDTYREQQLVEVKLPVFELNIYNLLSTSLIVASLIVYKREIGKSIIEESVKVQLLYTLLFMYVLAEIFVSFCMLVLLNVPMVPAL